MADTQHTHSLRILSLNIQVGLRATRYRHYVTQAWRHVLPSRGVRATLDAIAELAAAFDVVALQEADAGSLRTARINQVAYLAQQAGFPYWHAAVNRNLGAFAQHCLGILSRYPLQVRAHHALPGRVRGRGALDVDLLMDDHPPLQLIVTHLSLGRESRRKQLDYLAGLVDRDKPALLMGDLNCEPIELAAHAGLRAAGLHATQHPPTFPSWKPRRSLDHLLSTSNIDVIDSRVLHVQLSDHLPLATTIRWPASPVNG
jgi:endonuclease/exonuclease/phosphatase family metal-dependent hydrolase